jgi:two-component system, NarL family, nitrate/nitrite response regulator NarL
MKDSLLTIVIADHQTIFRDSLKHLLAIDRGMSVVADTGDAAEAIDLVHAYRPDVLLLEVAMTGGLDLLKHIASTPVKTLALTAYTDKRCVLDSLQFVRGVVLKESPPELLFDSIRRVAGDESGILLDDLTLVIDDMCAQAQHQGVVAQRSSRFGLTPRELDIVDAVAAGETNKDIAQRLALSEKTVKHHLSNIFDKTGVFSRVELALFAINHQLARDPQQAAEATPVVSVSAFEPKH